jgi:hypothetical protein
MATKNPRRQAASYRAMARSHRRLMPFVALFWLVPAAALVVAFTREWHVMVKVFAGVGVVSGLLQHAKAFAEFREYSRKARELETAGLDRG